MKLAAEVGVPFNEFWEMTPYELNLTANAYFNRKKNKFEEALSLEYYNAMWTIQWLGKKSNHPRPLNEILDNLYKKKSVMTDEHMLKQAIALNRAIGGTINLAKARDTL